MIPTTRSQPLNILKKENSLECGNDENAENPANSFVFDKWYSLRLEAGTESEDSVSDIADDEIDDGEGLVVTKNKYLDKILRYAQNIAIAICWLTFTYFLMTNPETEYNKINVSVPAGKDGLIFNILNGEHDSGLCLRLYGSFIKNTFIFDEVRLGQYDIPYLAVDLQLLDHNGTVQTTTSALHLFLGEERLWGKLKIEMVEKIIEDTNLAEGTAQLRFHSNINESIALQVAYEFTTVSKKSGLLLGLLLMFMIYIALMCEMKHRTVAGIICSTLAVGILAAVHLRPSISVVFNEWGNIDTIMLFFGVSIIIEVLSETGLQDHLAAVSYELAHGHIWPMLHCVLLVSCLLSNIFDEILLVLFIAPICLRLCEIMQLNCTPVLSALVIAINVGSTLTPLSSLSNNLIVNSPFLPKDNIEFGEFVAHMMPATLLALTQSYCHLRLQFNNSDKIRHFESFQVRRLKRLISVWRKTAMGLGDYTWDDTLARKTVDRRIVSLRKRLRRLGRMPEKPTDFEERVQNLRKNYPIKKPLLLVICLLALFLILMVSILARIPDMFKVSKGWTAIITGLFILSLTCYEDMEGILARIDWCTMLFFVTLSIIVQVLITLGLLDHIGLLLEHFVSSMDKHYQLAVAILSIIWISAILTTFIDNVPVADFMMRIIGTLALNQNINIPLMPLVWSLALGCSLGSNGSIVGAVANIACAGVASRHGYRLTFFGYFRIGFFIMLGNIAVSSCYLLLVHVGFQWH